MMKEFLKYIKKNDEFVFNETDYNDYTFVYDLMIGVTESAPETLSYEHPKHGSCYVKIILDEPYKLLKMNDMTPKVLYNVKILLHGTIVLQRYFLFEGSYIYEIEQFIPEHIGFYKPEDLPFEEMIKCKNCGAKIELE